MASPEPGEILRFRAFDLDVAAYELRHDGRPIHLERQPMDLLILLVQRRRTLITRGEITDRLWGKDVFVDVETGVHTAIRKIRQALGDSADTPTFVETVPGKGYRFIAPVEVIPRVVDGLGSLPPGPAPSKAAAGPAVDAPTTPAATAGLPGSDTAQPAVRPAAARWKPLAAGLLATAVLGGVAAWLARNASGPPAPLTVGVLPVANLSAQADRDYLADGLTEETIVSLGRIDPSRLHVIGRTSMMAYKQTTKSLGEIGSELGADYLVESSLRSEGGSLRVTARLVRVRDQVQVWSDAFDRTATSWLGLQQELSEAIAAPIRFTLSPELRETLSRRQTRNADAYDLYLRGRNFANQRTPATNKPAIEYFQRATEIDPGYALAWATLSLTYAASPVNGDANPADIRTIAHEAAERAIRADPNLAESQYAAGYVAWLLDWNWAEAERGLRRAVALDVNLVMAHASLGHLLSQTGRHEDAQRELRRAREIEPLFAMSHALSSHVSFQARDYAAAVTHGRQAVVLDPEFWIGHMTLGQAYLQLGQIDAAQESLTTAARFSGANSKVISLRGYLLAKTGRTAEARQLLTTMEAASRQRYVPPYAFALVHAGLGDREAVFDWLDRASAARDVHLIFLTADPKWDPYRADPRFERLLERCGFGTPTPRRSP
jgi:TolB-like protein/DNA-binding winged helix-turn-helix (wHTH) protein/Flp pilus assembly protein TadD